jgi:hypothetical protein
MQVYVVSQKYENVGLFAKWRVQIMRNSVQYVPSYLTYIICGQQSLLLLLSSLLHCYFVVFIILFFFTASVIGHLAVDAVH